MSPPQSSDQTTASPRLITAGINVPNSLAQYSEAVFIPSVLIAEGVQPGTIEAYRKAVRRFIGWCGCNIQVTDVDEMLVERFSRSLVLEGVSFKHARAAGVYVRRIVRHGAPYRCLKNIGKRPHEQTATVIRGMSDDELRRPELSLLRFLETEYAPRKLLGCKQSSVQQIVFVIRRFAKFLGRAPILSDLNSAQVSAFMNWVLNVRGLSIATTNGSRQCLTTLSNYAVKRKILRETLDDVDKLRARRSIPTAFTMEEMGRIIAAARQQTTPKLMIYPAFALWPALIRTAYETGLRRSALLNLRLADWVPERREITALAEHAKTGVSQSFVLTQETADAIQLMISEAHIQTDDPPELLFPLMIGKEQSNYHLRKILERARCYIAGDETWHKLRRTCATHIAAKLGFEAAARHLAHTSTSTTMRYVDIRQTGYSATAAEHLPQPVFSR